MQKTLFLLIGLVALSMCGMLVLRDRYSNFAVRNAQFERVENGMTEKQVLAILGEPTVRAGIDGKVLVMRWQFGPDNRRDGFIDMVMTESTQCYEVMGKWIYEPLPLWDRIKEALGLVKEERPGSTFSF